MSDTLRSAAPAPRPAAVDTGHAPLPSLTAVSWLAWFSFREMSRRKRLLSLAAINLLPVLVVLSIRIWFPDEGITAQMQLASLSYEVIIPFLIPITAMAVGIPAIGEQIDDGTIVFTWTRPIKRRAIFLGRLLAAQVVSIALMSGALVLCFLIMVSQGLGVIDWAFLKLYLMTFLIIAIGAVSYASVFAAMGTHFRKPVLPAILFAFGWENLVTNIPARVQEYGLRFHLRNLIEQPQSVPDDLPGLLGAILTQAFQRDPVPKLQSVAVLLGVALVATLVGTWLLKHKEITN
ncbi:ABC transporter permease subunit [bacterium]|nr:ABC transporter permease subunit [bacterium]